MLDVQDAIRLIAKAHDHGVSQTRLLKLLWIAELRYCEKTGQRLTNATWFRWDYGPFSKDVINTAKADTTLLKEQAVSPDGPMLAFHATTAPEVDDQEAVKVLADTVWLYNKYNLHEILAEVYEDGFFNDTPYGSDFEFRRLPEFRDIDISAEELQEIWSSPSFPVSSIDDLFEDEAETA